jgi:hypothetical protein
MTKIPDSCDIQFLARFDVVHYGSIEAGQELGYDDPDDVGLYHVQCEGAWENSFRSLDEAVGWLSYMLGFDVKARPAASYGSEDRWELAPADDGERICEECGEGYNTEEYGENDGLCARCNP